MEKEKEYYVYKVYYRGILVYIGKGRGKRWKHVAKGGSSNELINDFYFRNKYFGDLNLDLRLAGRFSTDAQARREEKKQIEEFKPLCNKVSGRVHNSSYEFRDKLIEVARLEGLSEPEDIYSKFDFKFLFTPKGLLCKYVDLSENSVFEYAREKYHIKIKKCCYKHFPEYFLCFLEFAEDQDAEFWNFFGVRNSYLQMLERGGIELSEYGDIDWHIEAINSEHFGYAGNSRQFDIDLYYKSRENKNDKFDV